MLKLFKSTSSKVVLLGFVGFTVFWILIHTTFKGDSASKAFGALYGLVALYGGIMGMVASKQWGGLKSLLGRAIFFIALGLLAQEFGQLVYAYMTDVQHINIPYPSIGDIGYFGSVLFYIYGMFLMTKAVSSKVSLRGASSKLIAFVLPLVVLAGSYAIFLRNYTFTGAKPLTVFLDFGYPLGEATYISIAIVAFLLSRKYLGGIMKRRVLLVLAAFIFQYAADFNFLYQNLHQTWVNSGYGDYLYLVSYFVMSLSLIYIGSVIADMRAATPTTNKVPSEAEEVT